MYNIKNLVNSPYQIAGQIIPARGSLENVELSSGELSLLKLVGYFKIEEVEPPKRGRKPKQETGSDETETRDNDESPSA
jgi:hypothetical protein